MRCWLPVSAAVAVLLLLLSAPQVRADGTTDTFVFTEQVSSATTLTVEWQLPASPNVDGNYVSGVAFADLNVAASYYLNGSYEGTTLDSLLFFSLNSGGGFLDGLNFGLAGANQVYTGPENNPTFVAGTYSGYDALNLNANGGLIPATLTITTPEPSSLLMLFVGFLVVLGTMTVKKLQV